MCRYTVATYTARWYTYPSEKSEFISWDDYSQYIMENKTCSKAPTSFGNTTQVVCMIYIIYIYCTVYVQWIYDLPWMRTISILVAQRSYRIWNGGTPHSWMVDFMENP